jgi:hypothetical protein
MLHHETELLEQLSSLEVSSEAAALARAHERFLKTEPVAVEHAPLSRLETIPVIAANDVAQYTYALPGIDISDFVLSMAPPFQEFFIEFQRAPNALGLHAWGAHFEAISDPEKIAEMSPPDHNGIPRWVLQINTYLEKRKGKPFGPVATHLCGLAEDGTWFRHANGMIYWGGGLVRMSADPSSEVNQQWGNDIVQLLFPALMTITFMHCKNATLNAIVPPEKLSRSHFKRHGRPLVRYAELTIDPLRRLLEKQRQGVGGSLGKALHLCRGHFKTFSPDAPLLGRATGTYWWAPQIRGSQSKGITLKDYRVLAPSKIGRAYNDANENPPDAEREAPRFKDPDSTGRGLAAHNRTQNYLANVVSSMGWLARSPADSEPDAVKGRSYPTIKLERVPLRPKEKYQPQMAETAFFPRPARNLRRTNIFSWTARIIA